MATVETRDARNMPLPRHDEDRSTQIATSGSIMEGVCAIATIVLAIVGLAGALPLTLAAIGTIVFGAALMFQGGAMTARVARFHTDTETTHTSETVHFGGGLSAGVLGGIAGIVLGILALLRVAPFELVPVAMIVFGAALIIGAGSTARLNALVVEGWRGMHETAREVAQESVSAACGAQLMVGLAAVILGIIGLISYPVVLSLVALLCLGSAATLGSAAVSAKMAAFMHR
jgi:hypothetical protein